MRSPKGLAAHRGIRDRRFARIAPTKPASDIASGSCW